jgi:MazG family protein
VTPTEVPQVDERDGGALGAAVASLWQLTLLLRQECPWDQVQTAGTIVPHTLEEAWEVADVARRAQQRDDAGLEPQLADFEDELGDLLFQVCFLAMWCNERDESIDLTSVASGIYNKLVRRHPHVFGDEAAATDADDVRGRWERVKREREDRGLFDGIPRAMPALSRARKVQSRAASVGFEYADVRAALSDLEDEIRELREAIDNAETGGTLPTGEQAPPDVHTERELGDVLYAAVNVGRFLRVDPEIALRDSTDVFQQRVSLAQQLARDAGDDFSQLGVDAQEAWYQRAKTQLRGGLTSEDG